MIFDISKQNENILRMLNACICFLSFESEGREGGKKEERERESLLVVPETSVTATLRAGPSQGQKP